MNTDAPLVAETPPDATNAPPRQPGHATPPMTVRVVEIVQTVLTALILAFIFRAFFIEAFIIPTGSMAEGLLGDHGTRVCPSCGWEYHFGPHSTSGVGTPDVFRGGVRTRCPNCHEVVELEQEQIVPKAGDRILVHKWPYLFHSPQRWDVIVFRDPADPQQNFIKRLAGLPGEEIEIIDGDVYVRPRGASQFSICRKTAAAQSSLWLPVFDQDFVPASADEGPSSPWTAERIAPTNDGRAEADPAGGIWSGFDTRVLTYATTDTTPRSILFAPRNSQLYLQDVYGYNGGASSSSGGPPYVGDVRIVVEATLSSARGRLSFDIGRDERVFRLEIDPAGAARLLVGERGRSDGPWDTLDERAIAAIAPGRPTKIEFGHVDYRVYARINDRAAVATTDANYAPDVDRARDIRRTRPVGLRATAARVGVELRGLRVERDVHYSYSRQSTMRAYPHAPFGLRAGEYFVLGDNSPSSHDSREWHRVGAHLRQREESGLYTLGTVSADQIVGQAFFVYLPGLLTTDGFGPARIPDLGRTRFVR